MHELGKRVMAMFVVRRLFLFLLLVADYAGDPYFGQSPLSRPLSSQDCFCHSMTQRALLQRAATLNDGDLSILAPAGTVLAVFDAKVPLGNKNVNDLPFTGTNPLYELMSLQC